MSLGKLYKYWLVAVIVSLIVSGVYVYIATTRYIATLEPYEDTGFAVLPYLLYAHIVGSMCTAFVMALLIFVRKRFHKTDKLLVLWLVVLYGIVSMYVYFIPIFFFFNPIALAVFAGVPYVGWSIAYQQKFTTSFKIIVGCMVLFPLIGAILVFGALR